MRHFIITFVAEFASFWKKPVLEIPFRDIQDLLDKNILKVDMPGEKRPSYSIVFHSEDISGMFSDIKVVEENDQFYLTEKF